MATIRKFIRKRNETGRRVVVLGAGISGLTYAYMLSKKLPELEVIVLDESERAGGLIQTVRQDGYCFEQAARAVPPRGKGQAVLSLVKDLGIWDELITSCDENKKRFVYKDGRLSPVPNGLSGILFSPLTRCLLSGMIKDLRVSPGERVDESVAAFVHRHFGPKVLSDLFEPFVTATRGGDVYSLSRDLVLPQLSEMEKHYGSILKALLFKKRSGKEGSAYPRSLLTKSYVSFRRGMSTLVGALHDALKTAVVLGVSVKSVRLTESGYEIQTSEGVVEADEVITTLPASAAGGVLSSISSELNLELADVKYVPIAVVSLGYQGLKSKQKGFGYLVSGERPEGVMGVSFNEQIFPEQQGPNLTSLSVNVGGVRFGDFSSVSDGDFIALAKRAVAIQAGITNEPDFECVSVHQCAMPHFRVGHADKLERIDRLSPPGLHVRGNFVDGVAIANIVEGASGFVESYASLERMPAADTLTISNM